MQPAKYLFHRKYIENPQMHARKLGGSKGETFRKQRDPIFLLRNEKFEMVGWYKVPKYCDIDRTMNLHSAI